MERDCESELSKLNIEQNACIYHFGASVIHGQRSNILRLLYIFLNVRKALFYRLYGHFAFVVNLTYLGLSSYIFAIKRG